MIPQGFVWDTVFVTIPDDNVDNYIIFIPVGKMNCSSRRQSSDFGYALAIGCISLGTWRRTPQLGTLQQCSSGKNAN